jgi:hypothetical protein
MKNKFIYISVILSALLTLSACAHRDCQGHKKTAKTDMGGWL